MGFVFSGNVGTGILLKKLDDQGNKWSSPVACGLTGVGWGLLVGGSIKDTMMFIFDEATLQKIGFDKMGLKLGAQVRLTFTTCARAVACIFLNSHHDITYMASMSSRAN